MVFLSLDQSAFIYLRFPVTQHTIHASPECPNLLLTHGALKPMLAAAFTAGQKHKTARAAPLGKDPY